MQLRDDGNGKTIPYPNMWNFPGGAIEEGEEFLSTAVREMKEEFELDLNPSTLKLLWTYAHDQTTNDYILTCKLSNDVSPILHEGAEMKWLTLDQIKNIPLGFQQEKIIPYIEEYLKSEGL
jgi:8-oxo-dGTP diphosphatase